MATKEEWEVARETWCADSREGFGWLSESLGVSRQAVSKTAAKQGWKKVAQPDTAQPQPVAQPKQPATRKPAKASQAKPAAQPAKDADSGEWQLVESRPIGRPTEYQDEFVDMMIAFFDIEVEKIVDVPVVNKDGGITMDKQVVINTFPTITRFASKIGVTRETLHDWATAKNKDGTLRRPLFSYAYARARDMQDALLVEGGMAGKYEGRFATLAAKNLIGWKDSIEQTIEATVNTAIVETLNDTYQRGIENAKQKRLEMIERRKQFAVEAKG